LTQQLNGTFLLTIREYFHFRLPYLFEILSSILQERRDEFDYKMIPKLSLYKHYLVIEDFTWVNE
jgi:hypothetical protein